MNHAGKHPEAQTKAGLNKTLQHGQEAAAAPYPLVTKWGKQEKKVEEEKAQAVLQPAEVPFNPEQKLVLERLSADTFQCFGVLNEFVYSIPTTLLLMKFPQAQRPLLAQACL